MKSNFSSLRLVAVFALMACFTIGYAQCDQGNVYGQKGQKTGFAIVFGDSTGQHVAPTSALSLPTFKGGTDDPLCGRIGQDHGTDVQPADKRCIPCNPTDDGKQRTGRHQAHELDYHRLVQDAEIL